LDLRRWLFVDWLCVDWICITWICVDWLCVTGGMCSGWYTPVDVSTLLTRLPSGDLEEQGRAELEEERKELEEAVLKRAKA
jgi:hypothetical protein